MSAHNVFVRKPPATQKERERLVVETIRKFCADLSAIEMVLYLDALHENLDKAATSSRDNEDWCAPEELAEQKRKSAWLSNLCEMVEAIQRLVSKRARELELP